MSLEETGGTLRGAQMDVMMLMIWMNATLLSMIEMGMILLMKPTGVRLLLMRLRFAVHRNTSLEAER